MKVDYHIHLEEGPYSFRFVDQTIQAMEKYYVIQAPRHTEEWLKQAMDKMQQRLEKGDYSKWWLDLYLEEALRKGLKEVGIVDHLYRFQEMRDYFITFLDVDSQEIGNEQKEWLDKVMVRSIDDFIRLIQREKEEWAKKGVTLKLGIEADYFEGGEQQLEAFLSKYPFDYVIGSVHFYQGWGFDNPQLQHLFEQYDLKGLYAGHFETVKKAVKSGLFDFIGHLDNMKVFNYRPAEQELIPIYRDVAQTLVKHDVATEVNPGLFYRYPVQEMCPSLTFMKVLIEEGVKFTTSSDSHYPNDIGIYNDAIRTMLVENGIDEVATFNQRIRSMKAINVKNQV
ncbi:histidinol phosphate phosphatase domain-containing protein [Pontibacillus litoralis]|uniref:Histidinol-phosphatase n=1 Tax=Pontibacillus litoralis JSM 072002 TaxID=1385512 RepID=A0A0A5G1D9_9BACI|nr:histidinol phosphate phosphatase domain-containing protein [Pontibacillus litoralis]KGX85859.1 histidinol-phosphatase [Pontibacillus litoralis JSM 072002]